MAADCGSVPYGYYVSKYEITNAQYAEFLNAVAEDDEPAFFAPTGIIREGVSGSYAYTAAAGYANQPVGIWWDDAMRFANWLNNGQGSADTETGAYTLSPGPYENNVSVTRNDGAITFLASENEWYKAAYYDAALGIYYDYPTGSDVAPTCSTPTPTANAAACGGATIESGGVLGKVDVGSYPGSPSPYGTFDQGGNAVEWQDDVAASVYYRVLRGGHWANSVSELSATDTRGTLGTSASRFLGFRVTSTVPEPGTSLLVMIGLSGLAARRRE
jgi:formylglycine-generating enzyme required for sulfatase activity